MKEIGNPTSEREGNSGKELAPQGEKKESQSNPAEVVMRNLLAKAKIEINLTDLKDYCEFPSGHLGGARMQAGERLSDKRIINPEELVVEIDKPYGQAHKNPETVNNMVQSMRNPAVIIKNPTVISIYHQWGAEGKNPKFTRKNNQTFLVAESGTK